MRAITYTSARNNLAGAMKKVCDDHAPVIVIWKKPGGRLTRGNIFYQEFLSIGLFPVW
jgi:hypothetical protein